jgi:integrase
LARQRKEENARIRFLSREEYDRLCKAIRESYPDQLPAFVVSVNTGMRLTEQYTIEWNQVDLKRRMFRLNKTKNGSARTVHLNSDVVAVLEPLQGKGQKATDRVFPSDTADFKTSDWFGECLKAAAITGYTWHCNRHTACSWLSMASGTMKDIQEMGGFKTIVMAARYAHLSPDHKLSIVERISSKYAKEQAALQGQH